MNRIGLLVFGAVLLGVCLPGLTLASEGPRDLGSEARAVFAAKCTGCHGPDLVKPKGRFGYVLDLARVAANREMVIPSSPEESELWVLVKRGEMPPEDAPSGALTAQQKDVIHAWIAAGAPPPAPTSATPQPTAPAQEAPAPKQPPLISLQRAERWLGKFHVLLVHFPIALVIAAAFGECWSIWRASWVPSEAVRFSVLLAAVAAIPTVALGWLHALGGHGAGLPVVLSLHRLVGTVAGAWAVMTAVFSELDSRRGWRSPRVRIMLFVGVLLIGLAGHFGGALVHGQDFFDW